MNDYGYDPLGNNSCRGDLIGNYGVKYANDDRDRSISGGGDGSGGVAKRLKFGIDMILSKEDTDRKKHTNAVESNTRYFHGTLHCCQMNHFSYSQFYPPLYISANGVLPVVRKYANFVIEDHASSDGATSKRKRIWSRAVFSKLQRKGLEKRFQIQKYIMKPDRKQLAATLGLTDAQVKVWFQNRRMKWRNSRENNDKKEGEDKAANKST